MVGPGPLAYLGLDPTSVLSIEFCDRRSRLMFCVDSGVEAIIELASGARETFFIRLSVIFRGRDDSILMSGLGSMTEDGRHRPTDPIRGAVVHLNLV